MIGVLSAAGGTMEQKNREEMIRDLKLRANGGQPQRGDRPKSLEALKAMPGISVAA